MGRQEKIQENTIYHQRVVNLNEVEIINRMYKGDQTYKKMVKTLFKAVTPQLVRDINTEVAMEIKDNIDSSVPLSSQRENIKAIVKEVAYRYVDLWFNPLRSFIHKVSCNVEVKSSSIKIKSNSDNTNTIIVLTIAISPEKEEDDLHIVLEWCTGLREKSTTHV